MASAAADQVALERNLRLIPIHQGVASAFVWIPVFVLFTRARFDLDGALVLASLYYFFVVALEVPSGWMSDRVGRVFTLRVAALCWIGAHLCFALGDANFAVIVLGQFLLAAGFAALSGTDVTFHYDTLEVLGRAPTFAQRQARVSSVGYAVGAVSALTGGLLGLIDVRWAFVAALTLAVVQFAVTTQLVEPPASDHAESFGRQLWTCLRYLRGRYLGWIFFYGIVMVTLVHVAFTLMQPWLTLVLDQSADDLGATPVLAGAVYATTALLGASAARYSATVAERIGVVVTLVALGALSAVIVTGMALWVHFALIALVALRSVQGAAAPVLISDAVASRTKRHHRATLLSMNSLAGRLGYGLVLLFVAAGAEDEVERVLGILSIISWGLVGLLILTAIWATRSRPTTVT